MMAGTIEARTMLKSACGVGVPEMEAKKTSSAVAFCRGTRHGSRGHPLGMEIAAHWKWFQCTVAC